MISDELKTCYRYHQKRQGANGQGDRAMISFECAQQDVAAGTKRYLPTTGDYGPKFEAYGESHMRWMENPQAAGLRLVGFADELSPHINHTGWFTDSEYQEGCARGVVYRLPARGGESMYAYGYADHENPPSACLCFDVTGDEREAAMWADGIAELVAERESEYQVAWRAGRAYDEAQDTIGETRRSTLALIKEVKAICPSPDTYPETYAALRAGIMSALNEIRELRKNRAEWLADFGAHPGFVE